MMCKDWAKIIQNLERHLSACPFGEVSLSFIVHAGRIEKYSITHTEKYLDISEVPDVSVE
jgi:hypothetical protein